MAEVEDDPEPLIAVNFIYALFLYLHIWIILMFLLLSIVVYFHYYVFTYFMLYFILWFIWLIYVFNPTSRIARWVGTKFIVFIFFLGSLASLGAAIWFVITQEFQDLKEWNKDYDDYTTAFRVFMIIFAIIPVWHELCFYWVGYARRKIVDTLQLPDIQEPLLKPRDNYSFESSINRIAKRNARNRSIDDGYLEFANRDSEKYSPPIIHRRSNTLT